MALFDDVFNKASIYDMLFFNLKTVLIHPTLDDLEEKDKPMYERWKYLSKTKYKIDISIDSTIDSNRTYLDNAIYYPEFSKIIAITYATLYMENGQLKREFKKIVNQNEQLVIATFMDELHLLSSAAIKSNPAYFPILCGHNIIGYDIPTLIKRHVYHCLKSKESVDKEIPLILKRSLDIKPWESGVIDTTNVWKFNGYDVTPLMLLADFLDLKKTVDLLPLNELSEYYWNNFDEKPKETLDFIALQSATQVNLVIQLMNELRQF